MRVTEVPARDVRPLIAEVPADLLALLTSLRDPEWATPTEAWTTAGLRPAAVCQVRENARCAARPGRAFLYP